ncbi:vesicle-associated membrane protein 1 isoform X1 [Neophocaena asiaeorientalis asiaeorientalis]|uniref:Vesicle-associated membrane protein 1 isoform X1 n=1 Tax=Neophocaena asiaeorientalis asiaeorientalis TaxID=1706337 RepID=A0A341ADR6_NEOAA|nr:vesicle-associated membrane protein 1 isoform X1 [Neophocaena asiaeorientalis asiaeorientalis]
MSAAAQPPTEGAEGAAPGGGPPGPPPNLTSNRRLQQTQAQVEEVVDIMRVNVDKVLERDQKLSELDDRADALQAGASQFESSAAKLKRKYWWKNCKMMIMLGAICAIIVVVIVSSPKDKRSWRPRDGARGVAEVTCSRRGQDWEEEKSAVPMVLPEKARLLAGGGWEQLGGCPLTSPVPGLQRSLGQAQSPAWSWCRTLLESQTCFSQLFPIC